MAAGKVKETANEDKKLHKINASNSSKKNPTIETQFFSVQINKKQ